MCSVVVPGGNEQYYHHYLLRSLLTRFVEMSTLLVIHIGRDDKRDIDKHGTVERKPTKAGDTLHPMTSSL